MLMVLWTGCLPTAGLTHVERMSDAQMGEWFFRVREADSNKAMAEKDRSIEALEFELSINPQPLKRSQGSGFFFSLKGFKYIA